MKLLQGRRAIVTGGSSGIGKATSMRLGVEGCSVCVNYYSDQEARMAEEVVAQVKQSGGDAVAVQADVGDEGQVTDMVQRTVTAFGGLDLLVNNAGIENKVPTLRLSLDDWNRVLRTNLTGAFLCMRAAGQVMAKNGGGVIVNMSSVHEHIPWPEFAHYCASKGGMKLLMQTVAREWAPLKIRVVNIAPGAIVTPINQFVISDPEAEHAVEAEIPLGRLGQPEEIAAAVAWVASDEASYLTGATIIVDGGMTLYPQFV